MSRESKLSSRVLLVNPPIYDVRFDWARWHQPYGLLQVGALLRSRGNEVRLIDCLQPMARGRVQRTKLDTIPIEGLELQRWHFGLTWDQLEKRIGELKEEKWKPDAIYVTCLMTFWWEGTRDIIQRVREEWLPRKTVFLGGVYPRICPDHAKKNIPGVRFDSEIGKKAKNYATNFKLYQDDAPYFAGLFLYRSSSPERIVGEIETKIKQGVREFAFFDDEIPGRNPKHFESVLDLIIKKKLNVKLRALGNLSPKALNESLVLKMKQAGYCQIFLHDDVALNPRANGDLSAYERGIEVLLEHGGYKPRTEEITAMVQVGVPGENLEYVAERLTRLAHVAGSVNLVPYQPTPGTDNYDQYKQHLPSELEKQNSKLFPFAKLNHATFSDYQELIRLAALLNSKYRNTTFDFLGDDEIAKMVRHSIAEETWKPKLKETLPLLSK